MARFYFGRHFAMAVDYIKWCWLQRRHALTELKSIYPESVWAISEMPAALLFFFHFLFLSLSCFGTLPPQSPTPVDQYLFVAQSEKPSKYGTSANILFHARLLCESSTCSHFPMNFQFYIRLTGNFMTQQIFIGVQCERCLV